MAEPHLLSNEEYKWVYERVPRLCLEIAITDPEKGILLTRRAIEPAKGSWHSPGGSVKYRETLEQAAKRIAKAELGVDVEVIKNVGVIEMIFSDHHSHDISVVMEAKPMSLEFKLDNQADDFGFFKEMPEQMIPAQKEFFEKYLKEK